MTTIPLGLCQCGCGEPTTIPTGTSRAQNRIKGVPMLYVSGHNGRGAILRKGPDWVEQDCGYKTPCLIWQHQITKGGYGRATIPGGGGQQYTHILAWEAVNGPTPDGLQIDHLCRVRACGNPAHMEPVTLRENVVRGIGPQLAGARQRAKTHCPKGHALSGDNLYVVPSTGKRHCKACKRVQLRESRARRK